MDTLTQRRLARCYSVGDLRRAAKKRLPRAVFDFADGAAEDETTMHRNSAGFDGHDLVPSTLVDVADVRMATSVLGQPVEPPRDPCANRHDPAVSPRRRDGGRPGRARGRDDLHALGDVEIILDGGVRRGTDVVKALALGACVHAGPPLPVRARNRR